MKILVPLMFIISNLKVYILMKKAYLLLCVAATIYASKLLAVSYLIHIIHFTLKITLGP